MAAAARGRRARRRARGVGTTPAPTSPVTGNAVAGKKLYYDYTCYGCHGFNGKPAEPSSATGATFRPKPALSPSSDCAAIAHR